MNCYFINTVLILLFVGLLSSAHAFKWVSLDSGDSIPKNAILIDESLKTYVGRAQSSAGYFVPAEVNNNGEATIKEHDEDKYVNKTSFDVLTTSEFDKCEWKPFRHHKAFEDIDQNVVRVGVDTSNGDSIFVARTYRDSYDEKHICSILLPKSQVIMRWPEEMYYNEKREYLSCDPSIVWFNAPSTMHLTTIKTTVSAGYSNDNNEIYVARAIQPNGNFLTGYAIPFHNAVVFDTSAFMVDSDYDDTFTDKVKGTYQLLLGEPNEYEWMDVVDGVIPDYAVVNGKRKLDLVYIALIDRTVRPITQVEALQKKSGFEILTKNVA